MTEEQINQQEYLWERFKQTFGLIDDTEYDECVTNQLLTFKDQLALFPNFNIGIQAGTWINEIPHPLDRLVYSVLWFDGAKNIGGLSKHMNQPYSSVSDSLQRLHSDQWVKRYKRPQIEIRAGRPSYLYNAQSPKNRLFVIIDTILEGRK